MNDTQIILIAWIVIVVGGFAAFSYVADRRAARRRRS